MMTAFMSYLLLDNDTSGRFQALIAAAVFRKEPVRWISSPALITLDGRRLSRLYRNRSTPSIGLRAIVVPLSMHWLSRSPVRGGSHSRLSWNGPDCRHGGYGRGMLPSRRRMSSRPEVTPGAPESSGDPNAGIATWRTLIEREARQVYRARIERQDSPRVMPLRRHLATVRSLRLGRSAVWIGR